MTPTSPSAATSIPGQVITEARASARALGITVGPDMIVLNQAVTSFLLQLVEAGGIWEQVGDQVEWTILDLDHLPGDAIDRYRAVGPDLVLAPPHPGALFHAAGHFRLQWDGTDFLIVGCAATQLRTLKGNTDGPMMTTSHRALLLGPTRARLVALLDVVRNGTRTPRVSVWGGAMAEALPPETPESAVILPGALKVDLLAWLDRFWALEALARAHRLPLRRGLLLVGEPGTGKTQLIRHLLWRYPGVPAHLFIAARAVPGDPFGEMLRTVRRSPEGAIVILEDVDRIADSGTVTREYLLNCLDGLLEVERPILWVATANDPTKLESNLLRRPGRFDRTVVIPLPDASSRRALLRAFETLPVQEAVREAAVAESAGLTGAHLRMALASATLAALDRGVDVGEELLAELRKVHVEKMQAGNFEERLDRGGPVGFAPG